MSTLPIRTKITEVGQRYVDTPVYLRPKEEQPLEGSIRELFGRQSSRPLLVAYQMTKLNWVKGPKK